MDDDKSPEELRTDAREGWELDQSQAATISHKPHGSQRMSAKTRRAVEHMAHTGASISIAAELVGLKPASLETYMQRPHIKAYYNQEVKRVLSGAPQKAMLRIIELGQTAKSEQVRLRANEFVAGVGGIAPVKKVEGRFSHSHEFGGYEIDTSGDYVDVTPDNVSGDDDG